MSKMTNDGRMRRATAGAALLLLLACGGVRRGDLRAYFVAASGSSSESARFAPERAFDGDPSTRWSSRFEDGQWLEAKFDRVVTAETVVIQWETARAADFALLVKGATGDWVEVARRQGVMKGDFDTFALPGPTPVAEIRIQCDRRATEWGNSIFEVYVYGEAAGEPPAVNLIGWKPAPNEWEKRDREVAERLLAVAAQDPPHGRDLSDDEFLELVSRRAFDFFWWETNPGTGLTRDRACNFKSSEEIAVASIANTGFALSAYCIGAERGWVSREEALARTLATLSAFAADSYVRHVRGFYPHFVNLFSGSDESGTEVSTIDTVLFLAGLLTAEQYFGDTEVSRLAKIIGNRVDWNWARNNHPHFVSHGLDNQGRFLNSAWGSSTEALLIYLVGMGSPTHPLRPASWDAIDRHTGEYEGYTWVVEYGSQNIFPFHYPDLWYDFRGRVDRSGEDYFLNAVTAVTAQREYCIRLASEFPKSYGPDAWGLAPADGLGDQYMIYGFPPGVAYSRPDGTVVMPALGGCMQWLPRHTLRALRAAYDNHRAGIWGKYGFTDAFNPTHGFYTRDVIGIDHGALLMSIENHRTGFFWRHFMSHPWIRRSTRAIGWAVRPHYGEPGGPVDLTRDASWRATTGDGAFAAPDFDDRSWTEALVPDRWENLGGAFRNYDGVGWYRAEFTVDSDRLELWRRSRKPLVLALGGVDDAESAFLNGTLVGETPADADSWRRPRAYTVPMELVQLGRNVLAIRITDRSGSGGIWMPPAELGPR